MLEKGFFAVVIILTFCSWGKGVAAEPQRYLHYLSDIPVLDGGEEIEEQAVLFDKAEGRVVEEVILVPHFEHQKIEKFYEMTLPDLGWKPVSFGRFLRNKEQLVVKIEKADRGAFVRFSLSPEMD